MPTNFPGPRSHGTLQDTEMDLAWQELMAITELQVKSPNTPSQVINSETFLALSVQCINVYEYKDCVAILWI